ncbi:MAG TPA: HAD family phosphatase [Clostridiales bacterium]|nr:HAD family phosphatase [Clostridiales bacterium]
MSRQFAVFVDIDGTLMSRKGIPPENIEAIKRVRDLGHKIFINTGRSYACIPGIVFDSIPFDGVVCGIGSDVRYHDEILKDICFSREQLRKICEHYLATDELCIIEGQDNLYYINLKNHEDKIHIKSADDFDLLYPGSKISKVTVVAPMTDSDRELLKDEFFYLEHDRYYEFTSKGCSKSSGMKIILDRLDLPRENCIAIGDSLNDIDALNFAGISIAMGNAPESVKDISDFVTEDVENAGVAIALEKYLLQSNALSHIA